MVWFIVVIVLHVFIRSSLIYSTESYVVVTTDLIILLQLDDLQEAPANISRRRMCALMLAVGAVTTARATRDEKEKIQVAI